MTRPDDEIERFFDQVEYGDDYNGSRCLHWVGPQGGNGKGPTFGTDEGKRIDPMRYAYALEHGDEYLTGGGTFLNKCGDTVCVNFTHIMCVQPRVRQKQAA